jgi:predicted MFS family arabinose efflux permease
VKTTTLRTGQLSQPTYAWLVLILFWFIYFLNQADRQVLFSVLPLVKSDLHVSDARLGLMSSVFFWVFAILVPIAGNLGDVLNRKKLIVGALIAWSAATSASGASAGFLWLLIFRATTAFGEAFYYPCASSMIADYHGERSRSTAMAIHQTSVYTGIIVSGALSGLIGARYGWRAAFLSFGVAGILVAILAWAGLREPQRGQADAAARGSTHTSVAERMAETFRTPTAVLLTLAFLGMILVNTAYLTWTPTLLVRKFGLTLPKAGFHATFWHHAGAAVGVLAGGRIADVAAVRSAMYRPIIQAAGLFLGAPFIFLMGWSTSKPLVYASLGLFGIFRGFYDSNLLPSLYEVIRPQSRGTSTGIMIGLAFLGGGFAPWAIGWFSDRLGLGTALSAMSLCYVASGILITIDCACFFKPDCLRMRSAEEPAAS